MEPEWEGTRALARVRLGEPAFVGYDGPVDVPGDLRERVAQAVRAGSAVLDGVVAEWRDEADLEMAADGDAVIRTPQPRPAFIAFDLLEVDGESLLAVPLLERKRQLAGLVAQGPHVRIGAYVAIRDTQQWGDTLKHHGFRRVILKDPNSAYVPGRADKSWLVIDQFGSRKP